MKVHKRVRILSPLLSSFTSLITRNRRKKLMEMMLPPGFNLPKISCMYVKNSQAVNNHHTISNVDEASDDDCEIEDVPTVAKIVPRI